MSGVIVSVKGRYAVLLTKNSDFIKVKNKNYSVGDEVKIPQYKGQILAAAASFIVVCGGISSYFVPAKYMSVDINPSVMMTINIYNRVINTKPLNDDAEILLSKTDVSGMSVSDSMDELIKKSEEIGYLNEHNKDVIVEVVDGIGKIKLPDKNYGDVEVIIENADKADLKNAKEMGVSIAKARAIAEYTKQNGVYILSYRLWCSEIKRRTHNRKYFACRHTFTVVRCIKFRIDLKYLIIDCTACVSRKIEIRMICKIHHCILVCHRTVINFQCISLC